MSLGTCAFLSNTVCSWSSNGFQSCSDWKCCCANISYSAFPIPMFCRFIPSSLHSAAPGPTNQAGVCSHLADSGAEDCVRLWTSRGVCVHGHGDRASASLHEATGRTHLGSESTGEEELKFSKLFWKSIISQSRHLLYSILDACYGSLPAAGNLQTSTYFLSAVFYIKNTHKPKQTDGWADKVPLLSYTFIYLHHSAMISMTQQFATLTLQSDIDYDQTWFIQST